MIVNRSRGVEPGCIRPHPSGPIVNRSAEPSTPPARSTIAPPSSPWDQAIAAAARATTASPAARPRRLSARTMTAAPSHATKAATSVIC